MINRLTTEYVTEYEEVSPRFDLIENVGRHAVNPRGDFTIIVNMWRTSYINSRHVVRDSRLYKLISSTPPLREADLKMLERLYRIYLLYINNYILLYIRKLYVET